MKKLYITPAVKVVELNYGRSLMDSYSATGLDGFDGYGGESNEDDEGD